MSITNAEVADRALELAEEPGGLRSWAALCVSFAAGTTATVISARKVLEDYPAAGSARRGAVAADGAGRGSSYRREGGGRA